MKVSQDGVARAADIIIVQDLPNNNDTHYLLHSSFGLKSCWA